MICCGSSERKPPRYSRGWLPFAGGALLLVAAIVLDAVIVGDAPSSPSISISNNSWWQSGIKQAISSRWLGEKEDEDKWEDNDEWDEDKWEEEDDDEWEDGNNKGSNNNNEGEENDDHGRWHPEKNDLDCEEYWRQRQQNDTGTRGLGGDYHGNRPQDGSGNKYGQDEYAPCREYGPPPPPPTGAPQDQQPQQQQQQQQREEPQPQETNTPSSPPTTTSPQPSQTSSNTPADGADTEENADNYEDEKNDQDSGSSNVNMNYDQPTKQLPDHAVVIDVSVALPITFVKGIPIRFTNVIKQYLKESAVIEEFLQLEFEDGRHFQIEIIPWAPGPPRNETRGGSGSNRPPPPYGGNERQLDAKQQDDGNNNNSNQNGNSNNQSGNNNDSNNNQDDPNSHKNDDESNNIQENDWNVSSLPIMPVAPPAASSLGTVNQTEWEWFRHQAFLLLHEGTYSDGRPKPITDLSLMAWMQLELQRLVYSDVLLLGPMGPYYDTNNYYDKYNEPSKQIGFLEWALQAKGIPIGGMSIPGREDFNLESTGSMDNQPMGYDMDGSGGMQDGTGAPAMTQVTEGEKGTASPGGIAAEEGDAKQRVFTEPLPTSFGTTTQWASLSCLLITVFSTIVLAAVASHYAKRREQDELWGNLHILENAQEDVEYLNVGWRFAMADAKEVGINGNTSTTCQSKDTTTSQTSITNPDVEKMMTMEVFDKTGIGYRDGDSLLLGGYEYRSATGGMNESSSPMMHHQFASNDQQTNYANPYG